MARFGSRLELEQVGLQGLEEQGFSARGGRGVSRWKCPPGRGGEAQGLGRESGQVE